MEGCFALILALVGILVAIGLLVWGILAHLWYLIVIAVVLFILVFVIFIVRAIFG